MSNNVITFPEKDSLFPKRGRAVTLADGLEKVDWRSRKRVRNERTMHTFLFRSYNLIVESDEADLVRDVCFNMDRAQSKLRRIKQRLKDVQEQAAAQVQLLTAAETKLAAAIVAALLAARSQAGKAVQP
jgi:hypothetical protein